MARDNPTPSRCSQDDELSSLLLGALGCEPPDEAFTASLRAELENELQTVLAADRGELSTAAASDGTPSAAEPASNTSRNSHRNFAAALRPGQTRRNTRRSLSALAIAAVAVLAVSIWSSRPSYSWTSMLRALENQPWIESATGSETQTDVRAWFSGPHRLVIVRSRNDVLWNDLRERIQSRYVSGSGVLVRAPLADTQSLSAEQTLLSLLSPDRQNGLDAGEKASSPMGDVTVLSQSWRALGAGDNHRIELDVILRAGGADASTMHVLIELDPETQLPLSMQRIDERAHVTSTVRFDYPDRGPARLSDVGVPADVVIRDVASIDGPYQLARVEPIDRPKHGVDQPDVDPMLSSAALPEPEPAHGENADSSDSTLDAVVEPPPIVSLSTDQMSRRIDDLLSHRWQSVGVTPAARSDDAEFHRRVYLDLIGRIPTVSECREFFDDPAPDRRARLIETLLARRDHATQLGAVWRRILLPDGVDLTPYGGSDSFDEWLAARFHKNVPYDQIVQELLLAEGRVGESEPLLFYAALNLNPEEIAAQTARAFLGIRLECAQCHDHRFDPRWKQTDFWGYAAFFAQISRPEGKMDVVSPVLRIADSEQGDVMLPETDVVVAPAFPRGGQSRDHSAAPSRREQLAAWLTASDNPHFARATVNRVWAHLFGRGLVEPVDDMRLDNPAVCPEVLDELAGYFVSTGYDLRELFHVIVTSQAYQLTSQAVDDDPSRADLFAQMNIKTLTAEQLYDSIAIATRLEALEANAGLSPDGSLIRVANINRQAFLDQFRAPPGQATDYQAGIPQALTLMNGGLIQTAIDLQSSGMLRSLEAPFFTDEQRVDTLYLATLSRFPDETERQTALNYIQQENADRPTMLSDVLWALLNSAEFALNH